MKKGRSCADPKQFAAAMVRHLTDRLQAEISYGDTDPLLIEVAFPERGTDHKATVSLHRSFEMYVRTGDMQEAFRFLDGVVKSSDYARGFNGNDGGTLNPKRIFPALRTPEYVKQAERQQCYWIRESHLPDLCTVFIEQREGFSVLISEAMLADKPGWDAQSLKKKAFHNLRRKGWSEPNLVLQSPEDDKYEVHVFFRRTHPNECQLLLPELTAGNLPASFVAAFPNRSTTMVLTSPEPIDSPLKGWKAARDSGFNKLVERSHRIEAHPLTTTLAWIHKGKAYPI